MLIRLRQKYLHVRDVAKILEFDSLCDYSQVLNSMANLSERFNPRSPKFTSFKFNKISALDHFSKSLGLVYNSNNKSSNNWLSIENNKEYLRRVLLSFVASSNEKLSSALKLNDKTRLNVLYINRPVLSARISKINTKNIYIQKRVTFFGDSQGKEQLEKIQSKYNLGPANSNYFGVLSYYNYSFDLSGPDSIDFDNTIVDFIKYLDFVVNENAELKNSNILLEADDSVKFILTAAFNSTLIQLSYPNRVYCHYDENNLQDSSDDSITNLLHQMQSVVEYESSSQYNMANNFLIY